MVIFYIWVLFIGGSIGGALIYAFLPEKKGKKFIAFIKMVLPRFPITAAIEALKKEVKEK